MQLLSECTSYVTPVAVFQDGTLMCHTSFTHRVSQHGVRHLVSQHTAQLVVIVTHQQHARKHHDVTALKHDQDSGVSSGVTKMFNRQLFVRTVQSGVVHRIMAPSRFPYFTDERRFMTISGRHFYLHGVGVDVLIINHHCDGPVPLHLWQVAVSAQQPVGHAYHGPVQAVVGGHSVQSVLLQ